MEQFFPMYPIFQQSMFSDMTQASFATLLQMQLNGVNQCLRNELQQAQNATCCILPQKADYNCPDFIPKNTWGTYTKSIADECQLNKTNCCNCGAPLYKSKCEYCGTINK